MSSIIEINKKKSKAGRTPISMVLHRLYKDDTEYNANGISWIKEYCEENLDTIPGMQLTAQFLDSNNTIPIGGHGNMIIEDEKVIFEDSLVVGSFEKGKIVEGIEINGETIDAVVGYGYIYDQRFPELVSYLQEQVENNNIVEGSVEICASKSKGNSKIIYDGGWKEKGRKPQIFDYSGHSFIITDTPADTSAVMLELNSYRKNKNEEQKEGEVKKMNVINKGASIEINKLSYDDIATLITRAFNLAMGVGSYCCDYYIYRFYPVDGEVVFRRWEDVGKYFMTSYIIENASVSIGEIVQVEEDWKPVSNSQAVEVNAEEIKQIITNKNGGKPMNEELNAKIAELSSQITELSTKVTELNSLIVEKDTKIAELNETLTGVNKSLNDANEKCSTVEAECNALKEEKAKSDAEKVKAEINAYFETEIPKNKFDEAEINSLKEYVEKNDLQGLKNAEAELIVKKFKEGKLEVEVETNSSTENKNIFFRTKEEKVEVNEVEAGKALFN